MTESLVHFVFSVLALLLIPGPDMALVIANGMAYGRRGALYSALGISCGGLVLATITALVIGVALKTNDQILKVIQILGSTYIFYLAIVTIKDKPSGEEGVTTEPTKGSLFLRGLVTNISNPKAFVFFLAFIPQFIPDDVTQPAVTAFLLGVLLCSIGAVVNFSLGVAGASLRFLGDIGFLGRTWGQWVVFIVFLSIALVFLADIVAGG